MIVPIKDWIMWSGLSCSRQQHVLVFGLLQPCTPVCEDWEPDKGRNDHRKYQHKVQCLLCWSGEDSRRTRLKAQKIMGLLKSQVGGICTVEMFELTSLARSREEGTQ